MVLNREFFNLAVIKAPLNLVTGAFDAYAPMRMKSAQTPAVFPRQDYQADPKHPLILWSPSESPELTAFMPHVGSGDYYVCEYAYSRFGFSLIALRSTENATTDSINEFSFYEGKSLRRFVRAMKDEPRWSFFEQGTALEFEELAAYRRRLVKERLTRNMVIRYAEHWGAPIASTAFWLPSGPCYTFR